MRIGFPQALSGKSLVRLLLGAFVFVLWASYVGLPCLIRDAAQISHDGGMTCDIRAVFKPTVEPTELFKAFVLPSATPLPTLPTVVAFALVALLAAAAIPSAIFRRIRGAPFASSDLKPMAFLAARMDG